MRNSLKWLLYMIPGLIGQIYITTHFHPPRNTSLLLSIPLFVFFSFINLMAYHLFFVPKKVQKRLYRTLMRKPYKEDVLEMEMNLKKFMKETKARQANFDGYQVNELKRLEEKALKKKERLNSFAKLSGWILYIVFLHIIIFNIETIGFHIRIFYIECAIGISILLILLFFRERKVEWEVQAHALRRCIQKCGEKDIFEFDNNY